MSDIFLSYASQDRERVKPIVEALALQGWSVWWDRKIRPGKTFDQSIEEALDAAYCVMVVWSQHSVTSEWVRNEAYDGLQRRVLVPVLIDDVKIPLGFRRIQAARLLDRGSGEWQIEFESLVETLKNIISENKGAQQLEDTDHGREQPEVVPEKNQPDDLPEKTHVEEIKEEVGTVGESQLTQDPGLTAKHTLSQPNHARQKQEEQSNSKVVIDDKVESGVSLFTDGLSASEASPIKKYVFISVGVAVLITVLILLINSGGNSTQDSNTNAPPSNIVAATTPTPKLETSPTPSVQTTPTPEPVEKIDVTGRWLVTFKFDDGGGRFQLRLKQSNEKLVVASWHDVGATGNQWIPQRNGVITGNKITIHIDGRSSTIYQGTVEGNNMKGTNSAGGTWTARRL